MVQVGEGWTGACQVGSCVHWVVEGSGVHCGVAGSVVACVSLLVCDVMDVDVDVDVDVGVDVDVDVGAVAAVDELDDVELLGFFRGVVVDGVGESLADRPGAGGRSTDGEALAKAQVVVLPAKISAAAKEAASRRFIGQVRSGRESSGSPRGDRRSAPARSARRRVRPRRATTPGRAEEACRLRLRATSVRPPSPVDGRGRSW